MQSQGRRSHCPSRNHPSSPSFVMVRLLSFLYFLLVAMASSVVVVAGPSSSSSFALKTASFVPPAAPSIASSSPAPTHVINARHEAAIQGYGTTATAAAAAAPPPRHQLPLWAKKKKTASPAASKKIQVKLLKYVSGTGSAGDVVLVTPAFYNNKLRPTKSATPITDDELRAEQSEQQAQMEANSAAATKIKEQLEQDDFSLVIQKKAGPDGQLFGAVSTKVILNSLRDTVSDDYLNQKQVKIVQVAQDGKKMRGDIKHVGDYGVNLALTKDISAKFEVSVQGES